MSSLDEKTRTKSLRNSFMDGIFASCMIGFTQDYFIPFLLFLGGTAREVGILTSLPNIIGSVIQLRTGAVIKFFKSRKKTIIIFVMLQSISLLFISIVPFTGLNPIAAFILLVILFTAFGAVGTPAWGSLMTDLVKDNERGSYFGWRNSVLGNIIVISSLSAGLILHYSGEYRLARGFTIMFSLAFIFRLLSWFYLTRMYDPEPEHKMSRPESLKKFLGSFRADNFSRFVILVSLLNFSVNIAAPYFAVLMIKDLSFSYLKYTLIIISAQIIMYSMMRRWGKLADAFGNLRIIKFTVPIISIIPLLWLINHAPMYLIFIQTISGFAWAGFTLCATNFIYDSVPPDKRVRYISFFNVINGIMLSSGALLGGFIVKYLPPLFGFKILSLFIISSIMRILVSVFILYMLKEVRKVPAIKSNEIFFSVLGMKPVLGVERKTITYLR